MSLAEAEDEDEGRDEEDEEEERALALRLAGAPEAFFSTSVMPSVALLSILNHENVTLPASCPFPALCEAAIKSEAAAVRRPLELEPGGDNTCEYTSKLAGPEITTMAESPSIALATSGRTCVA
jgi:hypothetical protein